MVVIPIEGSHPISFLIFVLSPFITGISEGLNLSGSISTLISAVDKEIKISSRYLRLYEVPEHRL